MRLRQYSRCWVALVLATLIFVAGCNSGAAPTPTPLSARALIDKAAAEVQNVSALRFKLQLTGAPAFIDSAGIISFVAADGSYISPDRVNGKVSAAVAGVPGQIDIVAIGNDQFMKHILLTGNRWLKQQFSPGFNADTLIRGDRGIKYALDRMQGVEIVGTKDLFGVQMWHISGQAPVEDISAVTVGLIRGTGMAKTEIYINKETGRVEQIVLVQPETATPQNPDPTTWTLELFDYGKSDIVIDIPQAEEPPTVTPNAGGLTAPGLPATGTAEATQQP